MKVNAPPAKRQLPWGLILFTFFILSLTAAGYFAWQLRRAAPLPLANFLAADKGYGVTLPLAQVNETVLAQLRQNDLTWLRLPLDWASLEPAPGQFNWAELDRALAEAGPDFKIIAVLQTTPEWARPANSPPMTPPAETGDFGNFARALAVRYGDKIEAYQIWHEPNLSANWGNGFVDPSAYADLLREAALNLRAADPQALILTAALAPTLENGPLNLNEPAYLTQLYQAKANRWFDIVAGQPYGFDAEPDDPARPDALNFARLELLRQVMLAQGDAATPIWATAFGWNALPADWAGQPSPWRSDTPETQAHRTAAAIAQARQNWPWLGPMLAIRWDADDLPAADPVRGFALSQNEPVLAAIRAAATQSPLASPGRYPVDHPSGLYSSGWRLAQTNADIPREAPRTLTLPFEGTRLDLTIQRGPFRGYLWVTVDGQPANALPRDESGRSYVVLYDPLRESAEVTLARYLSPGPHQAVIEAEGGWGQWAITGWTVSQEPDPRPAPLGLTVAGTLALLAGLGWLLWLLRAPAALARQLWAWGEVLVALFAILGPRGQLVVTFALALAVYLLPGWGSLLFLPLLALAVLIRPDLGLALVAFTLSFFLAYKQWPIGSFSPVELALALCAAGLVFRVLLSWGRTRFTPEEDPSSIYHSPFTIHYSQLDYAALALVALSLAATIAAENFGVSLREWRVVVVESVIFYFLVRLGLDFTPPSPVDRRPPTADRQPVPTQPSNLPTRQPSNLLTFQPVNLPTQWVWRLVDAFVAGAVLQAAIALYLYFFTEQAITAEGVRRAMGLAYGSPNNLALFLGRAWPILLAVALFPHNSTKRARRWLYGVGLVVVSLALYLTFSKGALLLGLPAGLGAMVLLYLWRSRADRPPWRRAIFIAVAGLAVLALALIPLSQTERFRTTFDLNQGSTGFFRLKLWQASLNMLADHWPLGVGLDNFLYQYRTRYILPEAWQEPNLSHPHNLVLDFGTRLGLGGLALLLWLQIAFWRSAWRLYQRWPNPLALGLSGSMVVFLAHGLVDNSYFLVDLAFAFFLVAGLVQRLAEES